MSGIESVMRLLDRQGTEYETYTGVAPGALDARRQLVVREGGELLAVVTEGDPDTGSVYFQFETWPRAVADTIRTLVDR